MEQSARVSAIDRGTLVLLACGAVLLALPWLLALVPITAVRTSVFDRDQTNVYVLFVIFSIFLLITIAKARSGAGFGPGPQLMDRDNPPIVTIWEPLSNRGR